MPFTIVRQDITKMRVDAIVNAANTDLRQGGGVCGAIFSAAGVREMQEACDRLAPIPTGGAAITPGFQLPAKYVIHAVGPVYRDWDPSGSETQLRSAYLEALTLAKKNGCESIAFPLISSGIYGYPKKEALEVAKTAILDYLEEHEMDVYLAVFDPRAFSLGEELMGSVRAYIDEHYVSTRLDQEGRSRRLLETEKRAMQRAAAPGMAESSDTAALRRPETSNTAVPGRSERSGTAAPEMPKPSNTVPSEMTEMSDAPESGVLETCASARTASQKPASQKPASPKSASQKPAFPKSASQKSASSKSAFQKSTVSEASDTERAAGKSSRPDKASRRGKIPLANIFSRQGKNTPMEDDACELAEPEARGEKSETRSAKPLPDGSYQVDEPLAPYGSSLAAGQLAPGSAPSADELTRFGSTPSADGQITSGSTGEEEAIAEAHDSDPAPAGLDALMEHLDEPFSDTLLRLIDQKGKTDVEVYKKANIDRRLFSKIRSGKGYTPKKPTILALAVALELTLDQTDDLLERAGYALSHASKFDVIVEYFILTGQYDIFVINEVLFQYDQPLLGSCA